LPTLLNILKSIAFFLKLKLNLIIISQATSLLQLKLLAKKG